MASTHLIPTKLLSRSRYEVLRMTISGAQSQNLKPVDAQNTHFGLLLPLRSEKTHQYSGLDRHDKGLTWDLQTRSAYQVIVSDRSLAQGQPFLNMAVRDSSHAKSPHPLQVGRLPQSPVTGVPRRGRPFARCIPQRANRQLIPLYNICCWER